MQHNSLSFHGDSPRDRNNTNRRPLYGSNFKRTTSLKRRRDEDTCDERRNIPHGDRKR